MIAVKILLGVLVALSLAAAVQLARQSRDASMAARAWDQLLQSHVPLPERYDPALVALLPEPARRYFNFVIQPGTRLSTVVQIDMDGQISLGTKEQPNYQPMRADQILAAPRGFVWRLRAGTGATQVWGSDGLFDDQAWTHFWLLKLIPVARVDGTSDHVRSAFGRAVSECAFWAPAFLLPRPGVTWAEVDSDTARVTVVHGALTQEVDIKVDAAGRPLWVRIPRWTNANAEHEFKLQPFGGELSDFRDVSGYRLPFHVDGGNHFGTPDYFPFYRARVSSIKVL